MIRSTLFVLGSLLILQACSPEPVYRLKAEAPDSQTSYYQGVEYIHMEKDSVLFTVSYYEHTSDLFALEVEITNNSNRIVRVAPDSFQYKSYEGYKPKKPGEVRAIKTAENPEQKILNLDMALSRQEARQQGDNFMFLTLQGLTAASSITADTHKEREEAEDQLTDNAVHQQIDRAEYRYDRSNLRQSRQFWEAKALRITDLWPEESIRGLIYFDTDKEAQLYHITAAIENLQFETWFRQKKHQPQHSIDKMD